MNGKPSIIRKAAFVSAAASVVAFCVAFLFGVQATRREKEYVGNLLSFDLTMNRFLVEGRMQRSLHWRDQALYVFAYAGTLSCILFAFDRHLEKQRPNKSPEPTPTAVTPRAIEMRTEMKKSILRSTEARGAPAAVVAHL